MKFQRKPSITATTLGKPPASRGPFGRAHRSRTVAVAVAAGIAAVGLALATVPAYAASTPTPAGGKLSWSSGVYLPSATPASDQRLWCLARPPGERRHRLAGPQQLE